VTRSRVTRLLVAPACLLGGAAVALCVVLLHDHWWGLLLGVATTAALLVALPAAWWGRLAFALGWVAMLWRAMTERPEGDYLVSSDVNGYALLVVGMLVLVAGIAALRRPAAPVDGEGLLPGP
jgi:hypothetical protein